MSDEEITYTTVRFHKSSDLQNRERSDETQGPREADHRECPVPWHLIAIPLGVLCSILLVTVAVLVTHIFQYSQEKHELQKTLNIPHQENSTMQNDRYLIEEMLKNKSIDYDALKQDLDTLNRTLNRCYQETKFVVDSKQHRGERVEGHWFCCGVKCYYFIMDNKRWSGCKQTCRDCSLSLLTIDDDDELKFLQLQIKPNSYWIGLSYDTRTRKWQWIDDGPSKLDLNTAKFDHSTERCAFLSRARLNNDNCDRLYHCICEKRLDKFPDSSCSRS
ncbi:killer cell lectin-like receptor 2 [Peromyscus californicus insignis]|uniref:killer cell lectin-like receptor 2 n=1 Tax=Peromyscus californicus insignis TaxID=564181 RepID=UPI0022A7D54F|nr:killer cell lectin-like receptor 2 [Peromyscus californicus insignis]